MWTLQMFKILSVKESFWQIIFNTSDLFEQSYSIQSISTTHNVFPAISDFVNHFHCFMSTSFQTNTHTCMSDVMELTANVSNAKVQGQDISKEKCRYIYKVHVIRFVLAIKNERRSWFVRIYMRPMRGFLYQWRSRHWLIQKKKVYCYLKKKRWKIHIECL